MPWYSHLWCSISIVVLVGYFLGNLNGSVCISQIVAKEDVRTRGSGNAGLTNFFRSYGSWSTLLVFLVDGGKAALACLVSVLIMDKHDWSWEQGALLGAVAVSLGHDFPVLLGFKGGKGIVCGLVIALVIDWRIALLILAVFVILFAITRYVSLGSVLASATFSIGFAIFHYNDLPVMIGGILLGALAVFMHRSNIKRLLNGTEKKVHLIHREKNKE